MALGPSAPAVVRNVMGRTLLLAAAGGLPAMRAARTRGVRVLTEE